MNFMEKCPICGPIKEDFTYHRSSDDHKFNFTLYEWNTYRKALVKDRHGVVIEITVDKYKPKILNIKKNERKGKFIVTILEKDFILLKDGIEFDFIIENKRYNDSIILQKANVLHVLESFYLEDQMKILSKGNYAELEPSAKYQIKVRFKTYGLGKYQMAVGFLLRDKNNFEFSIARELVIHIISNIDDDIIYQKMKSPYTGQLWNDTVIKRAINFEPDMRHEIPKEMVKILSYGLKQKSYSGQDLQTFNYVSNVINKGCIHETYQEYYHFLLWMDELGAQIKLQRYNLEKIPFQFNKKYVEIQVPGLSEKRPSVIKGDEIRIKVHGDKVGYSGVVDKVLENSVWINKIQDEFLNILKNDPTLLVDVNFSISRLSYLRMHQAIDHCGFEYKELLFPSVPIRKHEKREINIFYNKLIKENYEQKEAVTNIVYRSSGCSPFIVFGPPGTGKTITICEAVVQISMRNPGAKILICAPANAACDMLTEKLSHYFDTKRLIRIHSENVDWSNVSEKIRKYSNRDGSAIKRYSGSDLNKFQIVVTTLILIGRYTNDFVRSHVFIDEAAQAVEPEVAIAVGGILEKRGQLVLAGDHKQLGPVVNSRAAEEKGLGTSLLTRLIENYPQYKPVKENLDFIVKLKLNYRSHPQIIHLPNDLFYNGELVPKSESVINDPINKIILPVDNRTNVEPCAIEFYGTSGKEEKDGMSPSYFNRHEVLVVIKYVELLLNHPVKVLPADIGIITPYQRQLYKIKMALNKKNIEGVEVGTVEIFQGREKRIIIISTVRGKPNLLLEDSKYNLGFVANEQRFNVAITRAQSKLIIVGNPFVLCYGLKTWKPLMSYCKNLGSFRGCSYVERNNETKRAIIEKLKIIKVKDDQYNYC